MKELLKTDLRRMVKDKLFLIAIIVGLVFATSTPLMYKGLIDMLDNEAGADIFGALMNSKTILGSSFSPMNNFGLILPILIAIVIYKDISYGTIRNKIISGKSRISIYLSLFISGAILMGGCMLIYALIQFGLGSLLLEYSPTVNLVDDIPFVILTLLFGLLSYLFITAVLVFLCTNLKNVGGAIVLYFGITFVLMIIGSITSLAYTTIEMMDGNKTLITVFEFLSNINILYHLSSVIGYVESYTNTQIFYIIFDTVVFSGVITLLGILTFRKKDLK